MLIMNFFTGTMARQEAVRKRMLFAATHDPNLVLDSLKTRANGLSEQEVAVARENYGANTIRTSKQPTLAKRLKEAFVNPFTGILLLLAIVSAFTNIIYAEPGDRNPATVIIICVMVMASGLLHFIQDTRSNNAAAKLSAMISTTATVKRLNEPPMELALDELVPGDIIQLAAGDMLPADIRILSAKDLFINQAALTGESVPVEKTAATVPEAKSLTEMANLSFMGSSVLSGSATGVVVATGNDTLVGGITGELDRPLLPTSFEIGVKEVSMVLIRFMVVMVPIVFVLNWITKGDWLSAAFFAISVAVGLTPEMLPMIVTTCLAKGALAMSKQKVIIKNLHAIQNLGSMDILCTDKTGTLTQDKVVLEYHLNVMGEEDTRVLRHAFLNSFYQTGLKNLLDVAIITYAEKNKLVNRDSLQERFEKVDEIPFDFSRRRMSVVIEDRKGKRQMITKGAVQEMLEICNFVEYDGRIEKLSEAYRKIIEAKTEELAGKGMRVLALAQKTNPAPVGQFSTADEHDMVLMGYLAFLDPPKETAAAAIKALAGLHVGVKVLTGDSEKVTINVCEQVGLPADKIMLGNNVDLLTDEDLSAKLEDTVIFAKLTPNQKTRIIRVLRESGHVVGYMGDGINDAAAMRAADVGISVDSAVDIAKEAAAVILLAKDLLVLEAGIIEGRKTYANMIKYIKTTAAANFGNMLSVLVAGAFLPFLPMEALQLLFLNMLYDMTCITIPWDNIDEEFLEYPKPWQARSITSFMLWMGPASSLFDILTYCLMYFLICPVFTDGLYFYQLTAPFQKAMYIGIFQSGWFIESMWSQTLVIHMLRTERIPFLRSRASTLVTLVTTGACLIVTVMPFMSFTSKALSLDPLPTWYFPWLAVIIVSYLILATLIKNVYIRRHGELL